MLENERINSINPQDKAINEERLKLSSQRDLLRGIGVGDSGLKMCILFSALYALLSFIDAFLCILGDMVMMNTQMPNSILFIKSVLVLPVTLFFIAIVQKGLGILSQPRIFELTLVMLAIFFLLFGFVIWPHCKSLQIDFFWSRDMFSDGKMKIRRLDFFFPILLVMNEWVSTVLYLVTELWGSLILSFMFFSRVSHQCTEGQLKRFMPILCLISGFVLLLSGLITRSLNNHRDLSPHHEREAMFIRVFLVTSILTLLSAAISIFIDKTIPKNELETMGSSEREKKTFKIGFLESFRTIRKSRFLMAMTNIAVAYSVSSSIFEATYKGGIVPGAAIQSVSKDSYMNRLNSLTQIIGSVFLIIVFFKPMTHVIERRGWLSVAIVAPATIAFSLLLFFPMVIFNNIAENGTSSTIFRSIEKGLVGRFVLENYIGMVVTSAIKISKYCFFDVAKEVISTRIDPQYRLLFRGIHDGLGVNMGKTIGSVYCALTAVIFDSRDVRSAAVISTVFVGIFCASWIWSTSYLNRKYKESIKKEDFIDIDLVKNQSI